MQSNRPPNCVRPICTTIAFATVCGMASAQATWVQQAPLPTGGDLHAISVLSDSDVWVCGDPNVVAHTTNAGQSWDVRHLPTTSTWAVDFVDAQHGWVAGNGFFHTVDGGQTWIQDNNWGSIYDVQFLDTLRGFACGNGGVTYRTTDGGVTWAWQPVGTSTTLSSIFFADAAHGWTVNIDGIIYASSDGGQSWTLQHDAAQYLSTVQFFDTLEGWAIGGDTFLHTIDGGANWIQAVVPSGTWSHGARFADHQHGISVGEYGNVTITSDFGQTWTTIAAIGTGPRLWDVESASASTSWYAGETGGLARTTNGGASWTSMQSGGAGNTHGLDAVDAAHAWAANDGGEVLFTVNGGAHWQRVTVDGFDNYGRVKDVDFLDTHIGWAVGRHEAFGGGAGQISRSLDGGATWQLQHSVPGGYVDAVEVIDAQTVLALGNVPMGPRFILKTTDSGQTWSDVAPSQALFMDADFVDASTGWVVGGLIYKSTDGGQTWTQQGGTPPDLLYSVSFADAQNGWTVGWNNTILHTTNGGQTWTQQNAQSTTNVIFSVKAFSATEAIVCGGDGFVARTHDGGQTWVHESVPGASGPFETLFFLTPDHGWIGGDGIWAWGGLPGTGSSFCAGDGSATACPCGNSSSAGSGTGCASSLGTGALITATGTPSLSSDTLVLLGSGMPNSFVLYFQGTTRQAGGLGSVFGDGLRCAGGTVKRLGAKANVQGGSQYPGPGDAPISVRGAVSAPGLRTYQCWYRNAASFCTPSTFNTTNGLEIDWGT
jgi:photosystem II stability/assembly factor-like uncharacterized protein